MTRVERAAEANHLTAEQRVRAVGDVITEAAKNASLPVMEGIHRDIEDWRRTEPSARFGEGLGSRLDQDPLWIAALGPSLPPR